MNETREFTLKSDWPDDAIVLLEQQQELLEELHADLKKQVEINGKLRRLLTALGVQGKDAVSETQTAMRLSLLRHPLIEPLLLKAGFSKETISAVGDGTLVGVFFFEQVYNGFSSAIDILSENREIIFKMEDEDV